MYKQERIYINKTFANSFRFKIKVPLVSTPSYVF